MQTFKVSDSRHASRHRPGGPDPLSLDDFGGALRDARWRPKRNYTAGELIIGPDNVAYVARLDFRSPDVFSTNNLLRVGTTGSTVSKVNGVAPDATGNVVMPFGTAADKNTGINEGDVPVLQIGGKLATSVIPALAITDIFTVDSEAEMLALTAQRGDIALRTDDTPNTMWILKAEPASTFANWILLSIPSGVATINGQNGHVVLAATDIGADPAGAAITAETNSKNYTDAQIADVISNFASKGWNIFDHGDVTGNITIDVSDQKAHKLNAVGDVTLSFTGWEAGRLNSVPLIVTNNGYNVYGPTVAPSRLIDSLVQYAIIDVSKSTYGTTARVVHSAGFKIKPVPQAFIQSGDTGIGNAFVVNDDCIAMTSIYNICTQYREFAPDASPALVTPQNGAGLSPQTRYGVMAENNGTIFYLQNNGTYSSSDMVVWNLLTNTGPAGDSDYMPFAGVVFLDGKMYVLGGEGSNHQSFRSYNIATNTWTTLASFPVTNTIGDSPTSLVAVPGRGIFMVGGRASSGTPIYSEIRFYNTVSNTWSTYASLPEPSYGHVVAYAEDEGKLYIFGGYSGASYNTKVRIFNPAAGSVSYPQSLPYNILGAPTAVDSVRKFVYIFNQITSSRLGMLRIDYSVNPVQSSFITGPGLGTQTGRKYAINKRTGALWGIPTSVALGTAVGFYFKDETKP